MIFGSRRDLATAVLVVCGLGWAILAAVDITIALTTSGPFLTHPLHSFAIGVLITGTLGARTIQVPLLALHRLDRIEASIDRIESRLAMDPVHIGAGGEHFRGVVPMPRARVPIKAAPTVDLGSGGVATSVRTMLSEETAEVGPRLVDVERAEERLKGYLAGLNDRDWNGDDDRGADRN